MRTKTVRVWSTDDGITELLVEREPGKFRIPGYEMDLSQLAQLGDAIADVLGAPAGRLAGKITPLPDLQ